VINDVHPQNAEQPAATSSASKKSFKKIGMVVAVVAVFILGIQIGNGNLAFRSRPSDNNKNLPADLDYSSVEELYDLLKSDYDGKLNTTKLLDGMKSGMATATGDAYTEYFSQKDAKAFNEQLSGSFTGIGAELGKDADSNLIIVAPIDGFPADKVGLRSQDIITAIDGKTTSGMSVSDAVKLIRGEINTKVTLGVLRNKSEALTFDITRAEIKIPSVDWEVLDGKVGYVKISQFSQDTSDLTVRAARELKEQGATSILLDLRDNPGGLLTAAIDIADLWLPAGKTILSQKVGGVTTDTYRATDKDDRLLDMPTVVLINEGSASASEIVAGALRDNNAAKLYGRKSYGKGSVQGIHELPGGAEVKITSARWYRPNGQNIDKKGIKADTDVKMTEEDYKANRDPQKDAALTFLRSQ
jgi:carboxyl-terminal processing protease